MDLLSTIRKSGSRGGVNFSWDEVANSNHRENYLGHSLKAPVGRWAKGRDLNWYASSESTPAGSTETDEERRERERKEELQKIKQVEEDAIARALGLPVKSRETSGANAVEVDPKRQIGPASGPPTTDVTDDTKKERSRRHGDADKREHRRHRSRSRSRHRDRNRGHHRRRSPNGDRTRDRSRDRNGDREERRHRRHRSRSRSPERKEHRRRDRSGEHGRPRSRDRRRRSPEHKSRRHVD